uniref:Transposase n=1 Tax=Heterorhabditis bacteriophora TaxID=37862 RepID=A0A1I7WN47_HETBA
MGVCMSHEDKIRQLALNHPPNYAKEVRKEAPLAPEHTIYDYEQVRQPSERLAVLSCPHARGLRPDRLVIVDLDETSPTYCKVS